MHDATHAAALGAGIGRVRLSAEESVSRRVCSRIKLYAAPAPFRRVNPKRGPGKGLRAPSRIHRDARRSFAWSCQMRAGEADQRVFASLMVPSITHR